MNTLDQAGICSLCRRWHKSGTTEHHLIPRQCHSNKWFKKQFSQDEMRATIALCRDCHVAVHRFIPDHKELGRHYNSREKLLKHAGIVSFVVWVRKQK